MLMIDKTRLSINASEYGRDFRMFKGLRRQPSEENLEEGRKRRRIEDIREGLRLEREAMDEVWDRR